MDIGKKEIETKHFMLFLEIYNSICPVRIMSFKSGESPDFICRNEKEKTIGFEITKIIRNPKDAFADKIIDRNLIE
ncbi:MAG: hypothetical protein AB9866_04990 [Syntrophobacteraceae bacterium]